MRQQVALIVDDEKDICILLGSYLKNKNFQVECAFTLEECLNKISMFKPTILFLDNNLPDGSGIETIPNIRAIHMNVKIVVISAMTQLRDKAITSGADEFIDKPISFTSILKVLEERKEL